MKKKENILKNFNGKEYFNLPKEGETKPVFYILQKGERLYSWIYTEAYVYSMIIQLK